VIREEDLTFLYISMGRGSLYIYKRFYFVSYNIFFFYTSVLNGFEKVIEILFNFTLLDNIIILISHIKNKIKIVLYLALIIMY
jgi:hypothetical protein